MTPEAQRKAIAETCGWKTTSDSPNWAYYRPDERGWNGELPDYLNDLNAMHEAETVLTPNQLSSYGEQLMAISVGTWLHHNSITWSDVQKTASATAAQRAEAFLKTIGKWEEQSP